MAEICNRCSRGIYAAWRTVLRAQTVLHYHPHCFTCAMCDTALEDVENFETAMDLTEIYCEKCFVNYFNKNGTRIVPENRIGSDADGGSQKATNCVENKIIWGTKKEDVYENLDAYVTPEESLDAIIQELSLSPPSIPAQNETIKEDESPENGMKYSIEDVIKNVDSFSERLENSSPVNNPNPSPTTTSTTEIGKIAIKRENSTSRIPRLKSLMKIPSATSIRVPTLEQLVPNKSGALERPRSILRCQPPTSKMNEYLNSKGMRQGEFPSKGTLPMKAKHSVGNLFSSRRDSFPRSFSYTPRSGNTIQMGPGPERPTSIVPNEKPIVKPPPMPITEADFKDPINKPPVITSSKQPISFNFNRGVRVQLADKPTSNMEHEDSSFQKRSRSKLVTCNRIMPNVLPSSEQLMSIMMKPRNVKSMVESMCKPTISGETCKNKICKDPLDCPICSESMITETYRHTGREKQSENSVTECGHIFHWKCIGNWLCTTGNNRCPICSAICLPESIKPVYLEAKTIINDVKQTMPNDKDGEIALVTLRHDYAELAAKYSALEKAHSECSVKSVVADSLRTAYEMECRSRVELQCENKRLQRKVEELRDVIHSPRGDSAF